MKAGTQSEVAQAPFIFPPVICPILKEDAQRPLLSRIYSRFKLYQPLDIVTNVQLEDDSLVRRHILPLHNPHRGPLIRQIGLLQGKRLWIYPSLEQKQ